MENYKCSNVENYKMACCIEFRLCMDDTVIINNPPPRQYYDTPYLLHCSLDPDEFIKKKIRDPISTHKIKGINYCPFCGAKLY